MSKKLTHCLAVASILSLLTCCNSKPQATGYVLSTREKKICDSLQIDSAIVKGLRNYNANEIEPFHYSLSRIFKDGKEIEVDPVHLQGLVLNEENSRSYSLVFALREDFISRGYSIFLLENNFNIDKRRDRIGVLKTIDKLEVLKQIRTDGINYDITNDSLCKIIKNLDRKYALDLIGASGDWCEFTIGKEPESWADFAREIYKICPDVVDQGTGTVDALAAEMEKSKRLYLWWD